VTTTSAATAEIQPTIKGVARVAAWSIAHRRLVVLIWVLLTAAGAVAAGQSGSRLSFTFDLPGQPAFETNSAIVRTFGSGGVFPPLLVVVRLPEGTRVDSPGVSDQLSAVFGRAAAALPGARTASWLSTGDTGFVSADRRTTFALFYPVGNFAAEDPYATAVPALEQATRGQQVAGAPVQVTGSSILAGGGQSGGNSVLVETLLAGAAALVVLAIVFGSLVAFLPLVIAAVAIPTAFVVVYGLTYVTTMSTLVQNIIALVGLGVAIDYALLIVTRWREERAAGLDNRAAVLKASSTAGSSVLFSGITVTVSLAALALTSVPFLRSIGLGGLLIPLISIVVSATLLPVVLDSLGPALEWPRKKPSSTVSRLWTTIARLVVRHRIVATAGSLLVLAVLIAPVLALNLGEPNATSLASSAPAEARAGLEALTTSGIGAGVLRPTEILSPVPGPGSPSGSGAIGGTVGMQFGATAGLTAGLNGLSGIAPSTWIRNGLQVQDAWPVADAATDSGKHALSRIRAAAAGLDGARVGGGPAQDGDFISALYGRNLIAIVAAIVLVTVVLLTRALRSVWLPVKALLLNLVSLAASFGVLTFIWQQGHGTQALYSSPATGAITLWVPLAVFALLFGLSMDYEVFILTRINEEYENGHDTDEAVIRGIGHTGRLITSGAIILFFTFVALGGVPQTDVKILSSGLAAGIIIDATVIRGVLAPALVALLGHLNWWLPGPVARLLRITPLTPPAARASLP
jgi:RND superfamily putative drug exporter